MSQLPKPPAYPFAEQVPPGDNRPRLVCNDCGWIHYANPKIVVGSVCLWQNRILLCKRAIEPRRGFWTLPAGYLEEHESPEAGAMREAREEACADIELTGLLGVYNVTRISQVQLIYRARLRNADIAAGEESLAVGLYRWDDIPWDDLAFPTVHWALRHYREIGDAAVFSPRGNPPGGTGQV